MLHVDIRFLSPKKKKEKKWEKKEKSIRRLLLREFGPNSESNPQQTIFWTSRPFTYSDDARVSYDGVRHNVRVSECVRYLRLLMCTILIKKAICTAHINNDLCWWPVGHDRARTVAGQIVENPKRTFGFQRNTAGILNAFVYPEWSSRITQLFIVTDSLIFSRLCVCACMRAKCNVYKCI